MADHHSILCREMHRNLGKKHTDFLGEALGYPFLRPSELLGPQSIVAVLAPLENERLPRSAQRAMAVSCLGQCRIISYQLS